VRITAGRHRWERTIDARPDLAHAKGRHVVVGDEDDPKVARLVAVDTDGNVELEGSRVASSPGTAAARKPSSEVLHGTPWYELA
jgi:hypothetical protein